jgi:hypothetical protein
MDTCLNFEMGDQTLSNKVDAHAANVGMFPVWGRISK